MSGLWHYIQNGKSQGPVSEEQLRALMTSNVHASSSSMDRSKRPQTPVAKHLGVYYMPRGDSNHSTHSWPATPISKRGGPRSSPVSTRHQAAACSRSLEQFWRRRALHILECATCSSSVWRR